jgi:transposase-like protein
MAQIWARGWTGAVDSKCIPNGLIKQTPAAFLELEIEEHLGPQYASHGRGSGDSRNDNSDKNRERRFRRSGNRNARDRNSDFDPKIVGKRQTSPDNLTEMGSRFTPAA